MPPRRGEARGLCSGPLIPDSRLPNGSSPSVRLRVGGTLRVPQSPALRYLGCARSQTVPRMPRDLPLSNGRLHVAFDRQYVLRDIYFPRVGKENHAVGRPFRFGVFVDGTCRWMGPDWELDMRYAEDSMSTEVSAISRELRDLALRAPTPWISSRTCSCGAWSCTISPITRARSASSTTTTSGSSATKWATRQCSRRKRDRSSITRMTATS